MTFKKAATIITVMVLSALAVGLYGCSKDDKSTESNDDGGGVTASGKYIAFRIICYDAQGQVERPYVATVMVFDQETTQLYSLGTSNAAGYFCTGGKMDLSKSYRIELYHLPDSYCIIGWWGITYSRYPVYFVDHQGDPTAAEVGLGGCDMIEPETDCWGG